ncbi:MAG: type II secretion system protein [Alphaproteobacteria bacterium PRO2]|nr:type II secretion system protein [Alphaproteobacteria bacterium PRO2]
MKPCKKNRGFTTLELAIVIIIFGLMMTGVMTALKFYTVQQRDARTEEAFQVSRVSLQAYLGNKRAYPCPASPTAERGSDEYGREQRDADGKCAAINGVQQAVVSRDQDNRNGEDIVLVGSIPFMTILDPDNDGNQDDKVTTGIPLTDASTYDGYGRRLTYAVTETLTDPVRYNDAFGTILVVDEHDQPLVEVREDLNENGALDPGEDVNNNNQLDPGLYAHFVIISHGENGRGAYMPNGEVVENCPDSASLPVGVPGQTAVTEIENCNETWGKFLSGLRYNTDSSRNDDTVKFQISQTSGLWTYVPGTNNKIMNTNGGNVGFGTEVPSERLDINGRLQADFLNADKYCDINENERCLEAAALGGDLPTMKCDAGEVITGIEDNKVHCEPAFDGSFTPGGCPAGCHGTGFERTAAGHTSLICRRDFTNGRC